MEARAARKGHTQRNRQSGENKRESRRRYQEIKRGVLRHHPHSMSNTRKCDDGRWRKNIFNFKEGLILVLTQ